MAGLASSDERIAAAPRILILVMRFLRKGWSRANRSRRTMFPIRGVILKPARNLCQRGNSIAIARIANARGFGSRVVVAAVVGYGPSPLFQPVPALFQPCFRNSWASLALSRRRVL